MSISIKSEGLLAALLSASPDAIIGVSREGVVTLWNPGAELLFGFAASEAVGRSLEFIVPPECLDEHHEQLDRLRRGDSVPAHETRRLRKDGSDRVVLLIMSPVRSDGGAVLGASVIARDITEGRLREREAFRLSAIVQSSDDAIVGKDLNGVITSWNAAAERMFGFTAAEAVGRNITIIIPTDRLSEETTVLSRVRAGRMVDHFETIRRRKDGGLLTVSLTVSPIRAADGTVIGASKIARDISEQKLTASHLLEEIRIVETLNRVGASVSATLDRAEAAQTVTDAATLLTSATCGAFFYNVGGTASDPEPMLFTLSGDSKEAFARFVPLWTVLLGPTLRSGSTIRLADVTTDDRYDSSADRGKEEGPPVRSYLAVPVLATFGRVIGALCFGHSQAGIFTKRHERLAAGIASWAAVALENARLYEEANQANRTKDEFLAVVSHELRTPLSAIMGWSHLLAGTDMDDASRTRGLRTIQRNVRLQAQLIEDLLDVSRIIAGKLTLNKDDVDLAMVIAAALEDVKPEVEAKNIQLRAAIRPDAGVVIGDAPRLQQIVWNLLSNAIKFTPSGGRIEVALDRVDDRAQITVKDTGQGISPDLLSFVFDKFRQGDSSVTRRHGGLGLGLGIVKHLTEAHGGTVDVASEGPGRGAQFTVRLPVRENAMLSVARSGERGVAVTHLSGLRVLVIDDDRDTADVVAVALERQGALVTTVLSGKRALSAMARSSFDVLLADIGMPEMDGYELIETIRARERENGEIRVAAVAVTAYAGVRDRDQALRAGFDAHLAKPLDPRDVIEIVARVVAARSSPAPDAPDTPARRRSDTS